MLTRAITCFAVLVVVMKVCPSIGILIRPDLVNLYVQAQCDLLRPRSDHADHGISKPMHGR